MDFWLKILSVTFQKSVVKKLYVSSLVYAAAAL